MNAEISSIVDAQTQSEIQRHRLTRIRQRLELADCAAIVLFDLGSSAHLARDYRADGVVLLSEYPFELDYL